MYVKKGAGVFIEINLSRRFGTIYSSLSCTFFKNVICMAFVRAVDIIIIVNIPGFRFPLIYIIRIAGKRARGIAGLHLIRSATMFFFSAFSNA